MNHRPSRKLLFAVLAGAVMLPVAGLAQDDEEQTDDGDSQEAVEEAVEEIVVVAPRPGTRRRVDPVYEDPVRARVLKDLYEMREDETEVAILDAAARRNTERVRFGYDPTEDYLRRKEIDLETPQRETTRPATIFRIGF